MPSRGPGSGVQRPSDSPFFGVERGVKGAKDVVTPCWRRYHRARVTPGPAGPAAGASCRCSTRTSLRSAFLSVTSRRLDRTQDPAGMRSRPAAGGRFSGWCDRGKPRWRRRRRQRLRSAPALAAPARPAGGGGAATCSAGATTARCGGRREAEKIGRSWVADSAESGMDHSGLPPGSGLTASRFGRAIGVTRPRSTLSVSPARSLGMMSSVEDVAAGTSAGRPAIAAPSSRAKPIDLRHLTISVLRQRQPAIRRSLPATANRHQHGANRPRARSAVADRLRQPVALCQELSGTFAPQIVAERPRLRRNTQTASSHVAQNRPRHRCMPRNAVRI